MKRVAITAIAAICTIAFTQIASAADMPAKAPIIAPVAPVSWTGFYVGGNVGYSWGKADTDQNTNATIVSFPGGHIAACSFCTFILATAGRVHRWGTIGNSIRDGC